MGSGFGLVMLGLVAYALNSPFAGSDASNKSDYDPGISWFFQHFQQIAIPIGFLLIAAGIAMSGPRRRDD
jgi:hypothetical protein